MELKSVHVDAYTQHTGVEEFTISSGNELEITYSNPDKVEVLKVEVPEGKEYDIRINILITEKDVE